MSVNAFFQAVYARDNAECTGRFEAKTL